MTLFNSWGLHSNTVHTNVSSSTKRAKSHWISNQKLMGQTTPFDAFQQEFYHVVNETIWGEASKSCDKKKKQNENMKKIIKFSGNIPWQHGDFSLLWSNQWRDVNNFPSVHEKKLAGCMAKEWSHSTSDTRNKSCKKKLILSQLHFCKWPPPLDWLNHWSQSFKQTPWCKQQHFVASLFCRITLHFCEWQFPQQIQMKQHPQKQVQFSMISPCEFVQS